MSDDHYFPQTYLKRWYVNKSEMHSVFDKKTNVVRRRSAKSICFAVNNSYNENLAPERLIENLIIPMENKLAEAISKIDKGEKITQSIKAVLVDFFIFVQFYSPSGMRLAVARNIANIAKTIFYNQVPSNPNRIGATYPDGTYIPIDSYRAIDDLLKNHHSLATDRVKKIFQAEATRNFDQWRDNIQKEDWRIVRHTGTSKFITSDHPRVIVKVSDEFGGYLTPLSPKSAVIRPLGGAGKNDSGSISYYDAPRDRKYTSGINEQIAKAAERFVIGCDPSHLIKVREESSKFRTALCVRYRSGVAEHFEAITDQRKTDFGGYLIFGDGTGD